MRLTDDISKAEEIYLSQMAAKDAWDKAHKELKDKQVEDAIFDLKIVFAVLISMVWSIFNMVFYE